MVSPAWVSRGFIVGVLGLLVGVGGFGVALAQLRALGRRADAIAKAVEAQQRRTMASMFAMAESQMRAVERDLLLAIRSGHKTNTEIALLSWRTAATEAQAVVSRTTAPDAELSDLLEKSLGMLDLALTDVASHGPHAISTTLVPKISESCRRTHACSIALIIDADA